VVLLGAVFMHRLCSSTAISDAKHVDEVVLLNFSRGRRLCVCVRIKFSWSNAGQSACTLFFCTCNSTLRSCICIRVTLRM
jgi:hypothetical protein